MVKSLKLYKSIVDGLADLGRGVYHNWIMERGKWPDIPDNKEINEFLMKLDPHDKKILVELLEEARDEGIHDTLASLSNRMNIDGLKIIENDIEMAEEPFGSEIYYDWECQRNGDPWPDEKMG